MKTLSSIKKRSQMFVTVLALMIVAGSISALAVPPTQTFVSFTNKTLSGKCCFNWGDTVKLTQPATKTTVVVTYSVEYRTNRAYFVGLSVNNGPCIAHGPRSIDPFFPTDNTEASRMFQWVVDPSEMVRGVNTFQVCGGGVFNNDDPILLGIRSLGARIGK